MLPRHADRTRNSFWQTTRQVTCHPLFQYPPRRKAGDVWCLPPVWNLRAAIWFHFTIFPLVLLPSPIALSCFISAYRPVLPTFIQETSSVYIYILRCRLFGIFQCLLLSSWQYPFMHYFLIVSVQSFFFKESFFPNTLENKSGIDKSGKSPRYKYVLF